MVDVLKTGELSVKNLISAMQRAYYGGEKFVLRIGEVEVGLVPLEDVQSPDLVESIEKNNGN